MDFVSVCSVGDCTRVFSVRSVLSWLPHSRLTSCVECDLFALRRRVSGTWLDDDHMAILGNDAVVKCDSIVDLFDTWSSIVDNDFWGVPLAHNQSHKSWRPVTTFSFRVGWCLHGSFLPGFHIVNTLLHVIATLLFQFLCESLVFHKAVVSSRKLRRSLAWTAAMLFGIHPLHVECVSNIVGRAEPLSAIFFILTILVFR